MLPRLLPRRHYMFRGRHEHHGVQPRVAVMRPQPCALLVAGPVSRLDTGEDGVVVEDMHLTRSKRNRPSAEVGTKAAITGIMANHSISMLMKLRALLDPHVGSDRRYCSRYFAAAADSREDEHGKRIEGI
jgi:hypothetical protein